MKRWEMNYNNSLEELKAKIHSGKIAEWDPHDVVGIPQDEWYDVYLVVFMEYGDYYYPLYLESFERGAEAIDDAYYCAEELEKQGFTSGVIIY